jgi:cardiolipin synthase
VRTRARTVHSFESNGKDYLHAKALIIDRKKAIIGSANLSWGGMFSNHEIAVLLEGKEMWSLASLLELLAN